LGIAQRLDVPVIPVALRYRDPRTTPHEARVIAPR
jgi:hypothetical protein